MLFYYRGIDKEKIKKSGYVVAQSRREAFSILRYEIGLIAITGLKSRVSNPVIDKVRIDLHKKTGSYFGKVTTKKEKRLDNKTEKANIKGSKTKLKEVFNLKNIIPKKKVEINEDMYKDLISIFKEHSKDSKKLRNSEGETKTNIEDDFELEITKEKQKKESKGRSDLKEIDWSLIENEDNPDIRKNRKIKVKEDEIILFTKRLSTMLSSGVSIIKSLTILRDTSSKKFSMILNNIINDIQKGNAFSYAISKYPSQFDSTYVAMVSIGENSGNFETTLNDIANFRERNQKVQKKIRTATTYPIIIGVVLSIIVILGSIFFIPMFRSLFEGQEIDLPTITKIVFTLADYAPYILILFIVSIFLIKFFRGKNIKFDRSIRKLTDKAMLRIPVLKNLLTISYMYAFSSTISLMLDNGIRIKDALVLSKNVIKNIYIKNEITSAGDLMMKGLTFSEALKEQEHFDDILVSIVLTGEESGKIEYVLKDISEYYDGEFNRKINNLMEMVQPLSILFVAILAVPIVLAIYLPVLEISSGSFLK